MLFPRSLVDGVWLLFLAFFGMVSVCPSAVASFVPSETGPVSASPLWSESGGRHLAANPACGLGVEIGPRGVSITDFASGERLDITLDAVGRGVLEPVQGVRETRVDGVRLERDRDGVVEWYANHPDKGLEQGVTLLRRPPGEGPVTVAWSLGGSMVPREDDAGRSLLFAGEGGEVRFGGVAAWDALGRPLPVTLELQGPTALRYVLDDAGAVYPVTIDPLFTQRTKIGSESRQIDSYFGWKVVLEGDLLAVTSPEENNDFGSAAGSVYVYKRSGSSWTKSQVLYGSATSPGSYFGDDVAIDNVTMVVGASGASGWAMRSGVAYVFTNAGCTWTEQAMLMASDGATDDEFGWAVDIVDDQIVVGAPSASSGGSTAAGAVYVFNRTGTVWTQQKKMFSPTPTAWDYFGNDVSLDGTTLAVNAFGADNGKGAVYVYSGRDAVWTRKATLTEDYNLNYGFDICVQGDTLVAGAPTDSQFGVFTGAAFVYTRSGGTWTKQQKIVSRELNWMAGFGESVSLDGNTLVVGAGEDLGEHGFYSGAAYVFQRDGTAWTQVDKITPKDGRDGDEFGTSAALDVPRIAIAASAADDETGAVYVFNSSGPTVVRVSPLDGQDGVPVTASVAAQFDMSLNASSLSAATFTLNRGAGNVAGAVDYHDHTYSVRLDPSSALSPNSLYFATLKKTITNAIGLKMAADESWRFTTSTEHDITGPEIVWIHPRAGASNVTVRTSVVVEFNEPLDPFTVNNATFSVAGVNGTVRYDPYELKVFFIPSGPLDHASNYTATVTTGVRDLSGNALKTGRTWTFTTIEDAPDTDGDGVNDNVESYPNDATRADFPSAVSDAVFTLELTAEGTGVFENIRPVCQLDPALNHLNYPEKIEFPNGLIAFDVTGLTVGTEVQVIILDNLIGKGDEHVYKAGETGFYDYGDHAVVNPVDCIIYLKDGSHGDEDYAANGKIIDPVGLGREKNPDDPGGSGSGVGCMLNPGAGFGTEWLLVLCLPVLAALRSRFRR